MQRLTPAMHQYRKIKTKYKDCILLFRMGDFYETFGDDAKLVAKELNIVLTARGRGKAKVPLAGVPFHALDRHLSRLIKKGYKVAICEQVEKAEQAKGVVKREVVRVVTPGTVIEPELLDGKTNNYLMGIVEEQGNYGIAFTDLSTGEFLTTQLTGKHADNTMLSEITRIKPAECLVCGKEYSDKIVDKVKKCSEHTLVHSYETQNFEHHNAYDTLIQHFGTISLEGFGCEKLPLAISAAGGLLRYVKEMQKEYLPYINRLTTYSTHDFMVLDKTTVRNLELVRNIRDDTTEGTLLEILDQANTPMGSRLVRKWLLQPLLHVKKIKGRLDAVEQIYLDTFFRHELRATLKKITDMERLTNKTVAGTATPRDLVALKNTLKLIPKLKSTLAKYSSTELLRKLTITVKDLDAVVQLIDRAIIPEPPTTLIQCGVIKQGYDSRLDELRTTALKGKEWISQLERQERVRTGIKSLKVGYNKVFGYYIEVTKSYLSKVPSTYIRKQTLSNAERFITPELKEKESVVLAADERIAALEREIFVTVRRKVSTHAKNILITANAIACVDLLSAFAEAAVRNEYSKPEVNESFKISIKQGRHPMVERSVDGFIPNETIIDCNENQLLVITGPNMSGKSTYMRQVALITILTQIGSFVPAKWASIGVVDRVFTRVGAFDDLVRGQSTFMVEMTEVANILHNATNRSLILLDEIGKGTSTFDGLSIAWAVAEYIHKRSKIGGKTLLATHYHQLTQLSQVLKRVKNYHLAAKETNGKIVFLRKLIPGGTDKSYGVEVAKLAGVPREVVARANEILGGIDSERIAIVEESKSKRRKVSKYTQLLFSEEPLFTHPVIKELKELKVESLTPMEAITKLNELCKKVKDAD